MPCMLSHFHLPLEVQVRVELSVPHRWGSHDKKPNDPNDPNHCGLRLQTFADIPGTW